MVAMVNFECNFCGSTLAKNAKDYLKMMIKSYSTCGMCENKIILKGNNRQISNVRLNNE